MIPAMYVLAFLGFVSVVVGFTTADGTAFTVGVLMLVGAGVTVTVVDARRRKAELERHPEPHDSGEADRG